MWEGVKLVSRDYRALEKKANALVGIGNSLLLAGLKKVRFILQVFAP